MRSKASFVLLMVLASAVSSAHADTMKVRQCLGEDGKTYKTTESSCPQSMPEIRKKIQSCTLPDGSRAFGDKCPQGSARKESIDSEDLSSRDEGLKNQYQNADRSLIQQGQYERDRLRMQQEYDHRAAEQDRQNRIRQERQNERAQRSDR